MADIIWNGSVDGDVTNASNWTGGIPSGSDNVNIPSGTANSPMIGTITTSGTITVEAGATIGCDVSGGSGEIIHGF